MSNEVIDGCDDDRDATVRGGGRPASDSVSFGSGDSEMRDRRAWRSGDRDGEGGVVEVVVVLRCFDPCSSCLPWAA